MDPRGGGARDAPPDPNSLIFQQFSAKVLQNNRTLGVGSPAQRNPGSLNDRYKAARNVFPLYHSILVAYVIPTSTFLYIFQYRLETFNEWRGTGWTTCPYYGGNVDGPGSGRTPSGWDIEMFPDEQFSNHVKTYEMPHTATVSVRPVLTSIQSAL